MTGLFIAGGGLAQLVTTPSFNASELALSPDYRGLVQRHRRIALGT